MNFFCLVFIVIPKRHEVPQPEWCSVYYIRGRRGVSHLLHEVGRVEPGHDAVVAGGGQELVEGHGLAAEVVLQLDNIVLVNRGREAVSLSCRDANFPECRTVIDSLS